jgi:hypothetical protein
MLDDAVQHQGVGVPVEAAAQAHPPLEVLDERVRAGRRGEAGEVAELGRDQVEPRGGPLGGDRTQLPGDGQRDLL